MLLKTATFIFATRLLEQVFLLNLLPAKIYKKEANQDQSYFHRVLLLRQRQDFFFVNCLEFLQ